jgi:hypothetical protein
LFSVYWFVLYFYWGRVVFFLGACGLVSGAVLSTKWFRVVY